MSVCAKVEMRLIFVLLVWGKTNRENHQLEIVWFKNVCLFFFIVKTKKASTSPCMNVNVWVADKKNSSPTEMNGGNYNNNHNNKDGTELNMQFTVLINWPHSVFRIAKYNEIEMKINITEKSGKQLSDRSNVNECERKCLTIHRSVLCWFCQR